MMVLMEAQGALGLRCIACQLQEESVPRRGGGGFNVVAESVKGKRGALGL